MPFLSVDLIGFRNFPNISLKPHQKLNIFWGDNGVGKTSLLEALYYLGYGRSFRTNLTRSLIHNNDDKFTLFSRILVESNIEETVGIEKGINGHSDVHLSGQKTQLAEICRLLPILSLNYDSFLLLNNGPAFRRQFLDWGVFHVKHSFLSSWREYQRLIKQRNSAIRQGFSSLEIRSWDNLLIEAAYKLSEFRQNYFNDFLNKFSSISAKILNFPELKVTYYPGWPDVESLKDRLDKNLAKDMELGYTYYGAHRADLKFSINGKPVEEVLSRGQQKILVWIMRLAQSIILNEQTKKTPIILIDDIGAELDLTNRNLMIDLFLAIEGQYFITAINSEDIDRIDLDCSRFHVKQNKVFQI